MEHFSLLVFELAGLETVASDYGAVVAEQFHQLLVEAVRRRVDGDGLVAELPAVPQVMVVSPLDERAATRLANQVIGELDLATSGHDAGGKIAITYRLQHRNGHFPQSPSAALKLLNVR